MIHSFMKHQAGTHQTLRAALAALPALFCACAGDVVNVGEGEAPPPEKSACAAPSTGDVVISNQAELDALEGCTAIDGDLRIIPFADADLRPLHALRSVTGWLSFDVPPEVVDGAAVARFDQLNETGWLALDGLEALESVGSLHIAGLATATLEPLSNLRVLTEGDLVLLHCGGLRDLHGLENLRGVDDLTLSCAELQSMEGLHLGGAISSLYIEGERLAELGSIDVTQASNDLTIHRTALQDLGAFASLEKVGTLVLWQNAELTNADGLAQLQSSDGIVIRGNGALARLPAFDALTRLGSLFIEDNAVLSELPAFPALNHGVDSSLSDERIERTLLSLRPKLIEISNNPALVELDMPLGWQSAGYVRVAHNAALERLGLGQLAGIDRLEVEANPALAAVDLGALATVDSLRVRDNPQLPGGVFDAVQTFARDMSSNAAP